MQIKLRVLCVLLVAATLAGCAPAASTPAALDGEGIHKIKHIIMIMQENRSFDSYFGTYPGADGIPMKNGVPTVCSPDPLTKECIKPYHDPDPINVGGGHGAAQYVLEVNGGKMDGFVTAQRQVMQNKCSDPNDPACVTFINGEPDVMGYHDRREIPNYWAYADNFVLQDRMFEPNASWSLPVHLFMVSAWSAKCKTKDPMSCVSNIDKPDVIQPGVPPYKYPNYAWTDLTYLMHKNNVSWAYYVAPGTEPDCVDPDELECKPKLQKSATPNIWNPLPWFQTVHENDQLGNIQDLENFYKAAAEGTLPNVAWIIPNGRTSEHPPSSVTDGQAYVTGLVNAIMKGPNWESSAIFVSWDDWGGFYDHVVPPVVDENGYGIRVPGLLISPYARKGYIDHQTLSFDAYLKFIEDVFMSSQRIDPATDGRPDSRPTVREDVSILGDLAQEFDFNQSPRKPLILEPNPQPPLGTRIYLAVRGVVKPILQRVGLMPK
jgi:phospholipase C